MVSALRMLTEAIFSGLVQFALANRPHDIADAIYRYFMLHVLVIDEPGCRRTRGRHEIACCELVFRDGDSLTCQRRGFQKADFISFPNGYQPSTL